MMNERVENEIQKLRNDFRTKLKGKKRAERTTNGPNDAYKLESEFCYVMQEIDYSPPSQVMQHIINARKFVDNIE